MKITLYIFLIAFLQYSKQDTVIRSNLENTENDENLANVANVENTENTENIKQQIEQDNDKIKTKLEHFKCQHQIQTPVCDYKISGRVLNVLYPDTSNEVFDNSIVCFIAIDTPSQRGEMYHSSNKRDLCNFATTSMYFGKTTVDLGGIIVPGEHNTNKVCTLSVSNTKARFWK